jgi:NAD(P)H-nitrite reductase large subunit
LILDKGNATAQDSNDRFLANIQKGGTYSVVPRIPGGEITPDKLIIIGQVAKNIISTQKLQVASVSICLVRIYPICLLSGKN